MTPVSLWFYSCTSATYFSQRIPMFWTMFYPANPENSAPCQAVDRGGDRPAADWHRRVQGNEGGVPRLGPVEFDLPEIAKGSGKTWTRLHQVALGYWGGWSTTPRQLRCDIGHCRSFGEPCRGLVPARVERACLCPASCNSVLLLAVGGKRT